MIPGLLNAPWKTNEDRQNLLRGAYNDEIIEAAAVLIAESLPNLSTVADPARHLDALPRREGTDDSEHVTLLRERLFSDLSLKDIVPDSDGVLRSVDSLCYPPRKFIQGRQTILEPLERWAAFPNRPRNWLHHKAMTVNRLAAIDRLFAGASIPDTSMAQWLEALIEDGAGRDPLAASMAAIQTAGTIPPDVRKTEGKLGKIVLTESGEWREPDPDRLFLPDEGSLTDTASASLVHRALASDVETLQALEALGIRQASPESRFRLLAGELAGDQLDADSAMAFWLAARKLASEAAAAIIEEQGDWNRWLLARSRTGAWQPLGALLLPGRVLPGRR